MAFVHKDQKERPKRSCQSVYRKFQEIGRDGILAQRRKMSNSTSLIEDNVSELNLDAMQVFTTSNIQEIPSSPQNILRPAVINFTPTPARNPHLISQSFLNSLEIESSPIIPIDIDVEPGDSDCDPSKPVGRNYEGPGEIYRVSGSNNW